MLQTQTVEPLTLELLKDLQSKTYLQNFQLVGGTAIALHLGHRKSIDLDLFTFENFEAIPLAKNLKADFTDVEETIKKDNTFLCYIRQIKVDFISYLYPPSEPIIENDRIRLLDLKDLAPMKLSAIASRGVKKDFYDFYFLLRKFSLPEMLDLYAKKFGDPAVFHLVKSLTYFDDAEADAEPFVFEKVKWKDIKKHIQNTVKKL